MAGRRRNDERPPRRPDPEPLEIDDAKVIAVGTTLWFVAWVVLLLSHNQLDEHGNEWWIWTAVAGLGLGIWGYLLVRKRIAARNAARTGVEAIPRGTGRRRKVADETP